MNKQQIILLSGGIILVAFLFIFGNTIPPKKETTPVVAPSQGKTPVQQLTTEALLSEAKKHITPQQVKKLASLENSVIRGDVKAQQIAAYRQLGSFWMDTAHHHILGAYYLGEAAKLENSQKNLTFAAHLLLDELMREPEPPLQQWVGNQAKVLFENILAINPRNDSAKVGIGACYMFGNISEQPMAGIAKIREVVEKDSTNTYAQMMLGLGAIKSGQFDRAIKRFETVLRLEPKNVRAIFHIAETYDRMGDRKNAIRWYTIAEQKIEVPSVKKELKERIKTLQLN